MEPCEVEWPINADKCEDILKEARDEQSRLFIFDEFDSDSKDGLLRTAKAIREQYVINGQHGQFWFHTERVSDEKLTEQIIIKWLHALKNKGILYFFIPEIDVVTLRMQPLTSWKMDPFHNWNWGGFLEASLQTDKQPDYRPGIAVDTLCTDFDELIKALSAKKTLGKFRQDKHGLYFYGDTVLDEINHSNARKALLNGFLSTEDHILSASEVDAIVGDDGTGEKRRKVVSGLKIELRKISHDIDIVTSKKGQRAHHYELIF